MQSPIATVEDCKQACARLSKCEYIGVDGEWSGKGREAKLCLLQVSFPAEGSTQVGVYLFDALLGGRKMFDEGGLKEVLENTEKLKILHDCRLDSDVLFHSFGVKLRGVVDTQVLYYFHFTQNNNYSPLPVSLKTLLRKFSSKTQPSIEKPGETDNSAKYASLKDEAHALMEQNELFWETRPMTPLMIQYAREDVLYLLEVYKRLWAGIDPRNHELVMSTSSGYAAQVRNMKTFPHERYSGSRLPSYGITTWDLLAKNHWDYLNRKYPGRFNSNASSETPDSGDMAKISKENMEATASQEQKSQLPEKPKNLFFPPTKPLPSASKPSASPLMSSGSLNSPIVKKASVATVVSGMPIRSVTEIAAWLPQQKKSAKKK